MANGKKVALVTGSNRGIGFETARQLGQQGITVIVSARAEREAAAAASKLRSEGIQTEAIALDVTNAADRTAAAKFIESHYGKLDILVNNAGVGPTDGSWACVSVRRRKVSSRASSTSTCFPW
jgi:NAD(P)-dependent dehydrogenase (short-subunit alcohol dehydrogenase family)